MLVVSGTTSGMLIFAGLDSLVVETSGHENRKEEGVWRSQRLLMTFKVIKTGVEMQVSRGHKPGLLDQDIPVSRSRPTIKVDATNS